MVDSKEIEELRALAFASIPTLARKASGNSTLRGKRKHSLGDTEDGEILSDEDTAAVAAAAAAAAAISTTASIDILASQSHLDCTSNSSLREEILEASSKHRGIVPISLEVSAPVSTVTPSLVSIVPIHMMGSQEHRDLASHKVSMVAASKDENGSSATFRMDSVAKIEEAKSNHQNPKLVNASRPLRSAAGSLPSRIPTAPLPAGGIRKEADAFLASLNIPAAASPSHLPGFTGDRNNSLVIKFSDDDSDTDGEQDGQFAKDTSNNKKWIANEPQVSSSLGAHRMGLSSQTTRGLKSEIDRVKKQIAAIERAKGMVGVLPVSRLSKSTTMEVPWQLNSKSGVLSTSVSSRTVPVDLDSLRQQIAAKESELKRRKQRGSKESFDNGTVPGSSWSIDALDLTQASDARLPSPEKSESEPGVPEVFVEDASNEAPNNTNGSAVKMEGALSFESNSEQASILCDNVLAMTTSNGFSAIVPAVQGSTVISGAQLLDSLKVSDIVEPVSNENTKPVYKNCDITHKVEKKLEVSRNQTSTTPKRKRQESDLRSESVKKQKRKGFSPVSGDKLMLNRSKEPEKPNNAGLFTPSLDESTAAITDVSDDRGHASQLLESKGNLISVQAKPKAMPTMTEPQQDMGLQMGSTSLLLNSSDGIHVAVPTSEKKAVMHTVTVPIVDLSNKSDVPGTAMVMQKNSMEVSPGGKEKLAKIFDLTSQQDSIVQAIETLKHVGTSTDVAFSRLSSPSRAIVERQGESSVWAYNSHLHNPNIALLQGVSNQRLEYGNDALWKLQEEEDAIDKELEEAQQSRRRCEVREHFARRQYREAQEALHSANLRCEMLFQKREILSASVKAAQVRLYSNKSSLMSQPSEGALVSIGSPRYSGKDPFRVGTSIWAKEKAETGNWSLNRMSDQVCDGFGSNFASVLNQSKELSRFHSDDRFVSDTTQPGANVNGLEEPVGFKSSASKSIVGQPETPGFLVRDKDAMGGKVIESTDTASCITLSKGGNAVSNFSEEPSSQRLSSQGPSAGPGVKEVGLTSGDLTLNSVFQSRIGEEKCLAADENRLPTTTLAEAVHGSSVEKESHHGFSSASFATDLERDGNQNNIVHEKSNTRIMGQEAIAKHCNIFSEPFTLHNALNKEQASNKITDESFSVSLRISSMEKNDIGICASQGLSSLSSSQQDIHYEPQHGACLAESLLVENAIASSSQQCQLHDGRRTDITSLQILTDFSTADACFDRQIPDSRYSDNSFNKLWSMEEERINVDDSDGEMVNMDPPVLQLGRSVVMQEFKNFEVPMVDLGRSWEDGKQSVEAELEIVPLLYKVPGACEGDHRLEENSTSSICFMPSTSLNLLFSHALHPHSLDTQKEQTFPEVTDQSIHYVSGSYESPLCAFRSYGGRMQSVDVISASSYSQLHHIDPHKVLCRYEHRGKCNNDECIWQHKRDYILGSSQTLKPLHQMADVSEIQGVTQETERKGSNTTDLKPPSCESVGRSTVGHTVTKNPRKWNVQVIRIPVYRIGSYLRKTQCFESLFSCMTSKRQLGLGLPFLALHRQVSLDMPYLLDSSLKLPTLNDGSVFSRQLRMEDRLWSEDEGQHSGTLGDAESLLEAALELFDYDVNIQKSEVRKSVLYVLSRGLEANPCCVAMWVVYLHLFYRWEKSLGKDDLFFNAVQHNKGSYELWMMFINSRRHLMERLEAYEAAIIALGSKVELQGHPLESKSSFLLDLALQKLNCMCTSDLSQEAASWIDELSSLTSEDVEGFGRHGTSSSLILLTGLTRPDLCILWICCAYVILQRQLPTNVIERLGCKQQLFLENIWLDTKNRLSCGGKVMRLMRIAASQGKGCMKLDVNEFEDQSLQHTKEFFAANLVQCAAVCEGLDCSFTIAKKYFKLLSPSVELTLLRAKLEEHCKGKAASLDIFEEALSCWPLHRSGKMRLWNQYIGCAFEAKGAGFVKVLLARCANEICDSDSCRPTSKNPNSSFPTVLNTSETSKCTQKPDPQMPAEVSNTFIQRAFQLLPVIVKRQRMKSFGFSGQLFSHEDAVFGYVNLAFLEALNKDGNSARNALHSGLNMAADANSLRHCLKEIALFTSGVFDNSTGLSPSVCSHKMLGLLDRCIVESKLLGTMHPLSRGFCESIKKRRLCQFVNSLLGPWPTGSSFLNSILETIHGPTLLPKEMLAWRETLDFTEKMLEVLPSNVRLATSLCRAVQSRVADFDSSTGSATLFWCTSLLLDSLCQSSPEAPEPRWVEAGGLLKMLEVDSLLEDFYRLALSVHPFSTSLWHGFLMVSSKTGNLKSAIESAKERGVKLDPEFISS
eukprot:c20480_g1_i2 orf=807-7724(-)